MAWNLAEEREKEYFKSIIRAINSEKRQLCPESKYIFRAFRETSFEDTKIVILGQDPYHGLNQANGLAFSVDCEVLPPSLINIFKEIKRDLGVDPFERGGDLSRWARQGVLLLNSSLTTVQGIPNAHVDLGWAKFTDYVIELLSEKQIVFMLWGRFAQQKAGLIKEGNLVLSSSHPSPLSAHRGFLGCGHFGKANDFLRQRGLDPVDWS